MYAFTTKHSCNVPKTYFCSCFFMFSCVFVLTGLDENGYDPDPEKAAQNQDIFVNICNGTYSHKTTTQHCAVVFLFLCQNRVEV